MKIQNVTQIWENTKIFNNEWTSEYFVISIEEGSTVLCLICKETFAGNKKWNIQRHYCFHANCEI